MDFKSSNDVKNISNAYHISLPLNPITSDMITKYEYNYYESNVLDDYFNELETNADYEKEKNWAAYLSFVEAESNKVKITL